MKTKLFLAGLAVAFSSSAALAQVSPEALAQAYRDQGYTHVEVSVRRGEVKVEASRGPGSNRVEVDYDAATGTILQREIQNGRGGEVMPGVDIAYDDDNTNRARDGRDGSNDRARNDNHRNGRNDNGRNDDGRDPNDRNHNHRDDDGRDHNDRNHNHRHDDGRDHNDDRNDD